MESTVQNQKPLETSEQRSSLAVVTALIILIVLAALTFIALHSTTAQVATNPPKPAVVQSVTDTKTPAATLQLAFMTNGLPNPTAIASTNDTKDKRLFVTNESGVIRIVNADHSIASTPFLDISSNVTFSSEMGLLGLAFSPNYSKDGYFFVDYIDKNQQTVVARYKVSSDQNKADASSAQTLLTLKQPYPNHNGGDLVFGPDGYLYATLGDGGSSGDPQNRAQNLGVLFGKILRLDASKVPYGIPTSNPFVGQTGKAGEIWDYGLRNPWKISFDSKTHDLYIADVGQDKFEELNVEPAGNKGGNNYGWRCMEGAQPFNQTPPCDQSKLVAPVLTYDHTQNRCSITGGYVYRGQKYPGLTGKYFYADYCGGQVYWTQNQSNNWAANLAASTPFKITTFGQDSNGELYLADATTGSLYNLQATESN